MDKKEFANYTYFKGEDICPFDDVKKSFWWDVERYAYSKGDKKVQDELSSTMKKFLKERVWQSESGHTTSWDEALKRAQECYIFGMWNAGYITDKDAPRWILK